MKRTRLRKGDMRRLPYHGSKALFRKGDVVVLPSFLSGTPIYMGVVVGKGRDKFGEHQKVRVTKAWSDYNKVGEIKKVRLMDLASLVKVG